MERGGIGRMPCFTPVRLDGVPHGTFVRARLTGVINDTLIAEPAA